MRSKPMIAGFARGQLLQSQEMGFGVAAALILDATLIRLVVLPSTLTCSASAAGTCPAGWTGCRTSRRNHPRQPVTVARRL